MENAKTANRNAIYLSDADRVVMSPGNPDVARMEVCRWYYVILPPSTYPLPDGGNFDWPGPEYDTIEKEPDARHYKKKKSDFFRGE
jgi:hypothetical protein